MCTSTAATSELSQTPSLPYFFSSVFCLLPARSPSSCPPVSSLPDISSCPLVFLLLPLLAHHFLFCLMRILWFSLMILVSVLVLFTHLWLFVAATCSSHSLCALRMILSALLTFAPISVCLSLFFCILVLVPCSILLKFLAFLLPCSHVVDSCSVPPCSLLPIPLSLVFSKLHFRCFKQSSASHCAARGFSP